MIHATCHTADNIVCLEFDATPWFSEADAPSIIDLARHEWTSAAIAESLERRRGYERLHDLIEYAAKRLQAESLEDLSWNTFECIVDGPEAIAWLEKNRPDVAARIRIRVGPFIVGEFIANDSRPANLSVSGPALLVQDINQPTIFTESVENDP
jgi:hypothetical protein